MPILSDVAVTFLGSVVVLAANGQLLEYAIIAFSERFDHKVLHLPSDVH
jgi:hypothetical protein